MIQAQLQVHFLVSFFPTTFHTHSINIETAVCVSQLVYMCCYWASLAGSLLALDSHYEATSPPLKHQASRDYT